MKPNSIFTILARLARLLCWLARLAKRLHALERATPTQRQQVLQSMGQSLLDVLHVRIVLQAVPPHPHGALIVANHISWLDIFVLNALYPSCFIAAKELRNWFVIGKMIENAGTVFIDRTNRKDIEPINRAIAERLQAGNHVCFFPEARTSLGNGVLPLKAALFQSAIDAPAEIQPVALRYYDPQHQRTEQVSFSGVNFFVSLWRILSMPEIQVRADFADSIRPSSQPEADRFALKDQAEAFFKQMVLLDSPNPERLERTP